MSHVAHNRIMCNGHMSHLSVLQCNATNLHHLVVGGQGGGAVGQSQLMRGEGRGSLHRDVRDVRDVQQHDDAHAPLEKEGVQEH